MSQNLPAQRQTALKPVDRLKNIIDSPTVQTQFQNAMGKHSDLFVASLIDVFNSGLQDCDPTSVVQEALKAAVLKLPISKGLGFAYLVPYSKSYKEGNQWKKKKEAQFQVGYKGLIQLAMRSGQLAALNAGAVFEGEFKSFNRITGQVDITGEQTSQKVVGYFAYMELLNGFKKTVYWTKDQVVKHAKEKSQSYKNNKSAWTTDFDAMATKTVLKSVISKYAPMSIEFAAAVQSDARPQEPVDFGEMTEDMETDESGNTVINATYEDEKTSEEPPPITEQYESDGPGY